MAWKPISAVAAVTLLVAACGGNNDPPNGDGSATASDGASADVSDSAEADTPLPADNQVGQPAPSISADDDHPQTQWKSQMFAGNGS